VKQRVKLHHSFLAGSCENDNEHSNTQNEGKFLISWVTISVSIKSVLPGDVMSWLPNVMSNCSSSFGSTSKALWPQWVRSWQSPFAQHCPWDPVRSLLNPNHSTILCDWLTTWYAYVSGVDPNTFVIGLWRWTVPICLNLTIIPQAKLLLVYRQCRTMSTNCPTQFKRLQSTKIRDKIRRLWNVLLWITLDVMGTERLAFVEPAHYLSLQNDIAILQEITAPTLTNSVF
jgi:hypothetical protein